MGSSNMSRSNLGSSETDVLVVGGGPAGLAAAIAARQAGYRATLADTARPPIDKVCGEGIMPDGLAALAKLGVVIPPYRAVPFQGIQFSDSSSAVRARFTQGHGVGIRRTALHEILIERAFELRVNMLWGARITVVAPEEATVDGRTIRYRWLVGADGQASKVRTWSRLQSLRRTARRRFGFRRHYRIAPWSDFVEVHWIPCGQMYVTPVGPEEVCVALVTRHSGIRMKDALDSLPEMRARLSGASAVTREQGAVTSTFALRNVHRGNCALVGEASGSVDAVTGEGLSIAFQQACALAQALQCDDLSIYRAAHHRIERLPRLMCEGLLLLDRNQGLRRRALRAFAAQPFLFDRMLAIHTGVMSPLGFGVQGALSFGWHFVNA
jgi:flavin-dependent dehydrogenase